jgi:hypothetical protein
LVHDYWGTERVRFIFSAFGWSGAVPQTGIFPLYSEAAGSNFLVEPTRSRFLPSSSRLPRRSSSSLPAPCHPSTSHATMCLACMPPGLPATACSRLRAHPTCHPPPCAPARVLRLGCCCRSTSSFVRMECSLGPAWWRGSTAPR